MKTAADYESEIRILYNEIHTYAKPPSKLVDQLNRRVSTWESKLTYKVFAANNEQLTYSSAELGYEVLPMLQKSETGFNQVGDYITVVEGYGHILPLLFERKTLNDIYGTLMNKGPRDRFHREIDRFYADPRFDQMIILIESTEEEFLTYAPKFNGSKFNKYHIGANVESRIQTLNSLIARDIHVLFAGSREKAIKRYRGLVRQWVRVHYADIIGLGK